MNDNVKAFYELISSNEEAKKELCDLNEKYQDADSNAPKLIEMAAKYGITLTKEDMEAKDDSGELSIEELENVSGGGLYKRKDGYWTSDCGCFITGGGTGNKYEKTCACVVGGGGTLTAHGQEIFKVDHLFACVLAGASQSIRKYPGYENVD